MHKKTIGVIVVVLVVVSLAVAGALLLNNVGNEQNMAPSLNSSDNNLLGGIGGNGGLGGAGGNGGNAIGDGGNRCGRVVGDDPQSMPYLIIHCFFYYKNKTVCKDAQSLLPKSLTPNLKHF